MRPLAVGLLCLLLAACATPRPPPSTQAVAPRVPLPPSPSPGEPSDIAGLQAAQLRIVFGVPSFMRKDGTTEMWRYDGAACKAFFFLYPYANSLLVRHVETLPRGPNMAADQVCLDSLRAPAPTAAPVS